MNNQVLEQNLKEEILALVDGRKSLQLASSNQAGQPYASYAPFAHDGEAIYVLLSEIALHGRNLQDRPEASVLIIEDEDSAEQLFARRRVNYQVQARYIQHGAEGWQQGIEVLAQRHGERVMRLSELDDFKLFRLQLNSGRYVKGFGKAYELVGGGLTGHSLEHLRDGHRKRSAA
ncbi:MAG: pyridoxamine 5'-phosphate oxidase family protein [Oleiphilaceae bacterium]|nr:pyridoxamine 5'-phosphate oxidase family protein [Oleiphilaceae bacterium]